MPANDPTLILAALAVFLTFMVWLIRSITGKLGDVGARLRAIDAHLAERTPQLADRMASTRADLAHVSAQTERALWSLSHFDERANTAQKRLAETRTTLDADRARLIAARGAIIRVKKSARLILKVLELRRVFLG